MSTVIPISLVAALLSFSHVDMRTATIREIVEYLLRHHGPELIQETTASLTRRIESLTARHGEEVLEATRKLGPQALPMIEQADEFASQAARLLARHGEDAVALVADSRKLALIARHGDGLGNVLIRHGDIAMPLVEAHRQPATRALLAINRQNGRRLAMLHQSGDLQAIGRTDEILDVIAHYGDRAMGFVWRNKGALTVSAALAAFVADPESFLTGAANFSMGVATAAVRPLVEGPTQITRSGSASHSSAFMALSIIAAVAGLILISRKVSKSCKCRVGFTDERGRNF